MRFARRAHVQGATANFELLKPDGSVFSYKTAALELADAGFHIRDGCMCNPGSCYGATGKLFSLQAIFLFLE